MKLFWLGRGGLGLLSSPAPQQRVASSVRQQASQVPCWSRSVMWVQPLQFYGLPQTRSKGCHWRDIKIRIKSTDHATALRKEVEIPWKAVLDTMRVCVYETDPVMCLNMSQNNEFYSTSCSCLVKKKIPPDTSKCKPLFHPMSQHCDFPEPRRRIKTHPAGELSEAAPKCRGIGENSSTGTRHFDHHLHCFKSVHTITTTAFKSYLMAEGREKGCKELGRDLWEHCPLLLYSMEVFV